MFIYGNYIDEVLLMKADGNDYYYAHDHLYSPAALIDSSGTVQERYEYDAYGNCSILEPNFAPDPDGKSDYGNPYLFTGRRLDILNSGSLKIQYNRNRYYDYYTGRWLTHDPLGYVGGLNLYEYVDSNPVVNGDPYGYMTESWFAYKFFFHYFWGRGGLWSIGADVLQRQEDVKGKIAKELKYLAKAFCLEAASTGGWVSGPFVKVLSGKNEKEIVLANENVFMRWTLNGAHYYIIQGTYEARACSYECPCTVNLVDVKHIWVDAGDLELGSLPEHLPDWLVWFATRIGFHPATILHYLGIYAIDFPVRINWEANNRLWKRSVRESFVDRNCSGWPWPLSE